MLPAAMFAAAMLMPKEGKATVPAGMSTLAASMVFTAPHAVLTTSAG